MLSDVSPEQTNKGIHCRCDECSQEWLLQSDGILEAKVENADEKDELSVRFFTCPRCGKVYVVNLFDVRLKKLLKKREVLKARLNKACEVKNVDFAFAMSKRIDKLAKRFNRHSSELSKKYNGTFTLASNDKDLTFVPFQERNDE